jgi:hypothetical protein
MHTMIDEIFDRTYQNGRAELNAGIDRAVGSIARELGKSLKALHRIEWSAPWASRPAKDA